MKMLSFNKAFFDLVAVLGTQNEKKKNQRFVLHMECRLFILIAVLLFSNHDLNEF